jgi:neurofibromin 1
MTISEPFSTFVESSISILKLSVDRLSGTTKSGTTLVDMGEILLLIGEYVHRLGRDESALRYKSRYCALIEAALGKLDYLTIGNEVAFRNTVLEWLSEWNLQAPRVSMSLC